MEIFNFALEILDEKVGEEIFKGRTVKASKEKASD